MNVQITITVIANDLNTAASNLTEIVESVLPDVIKDGRINPLPYKQTDGYINGADGGSYLLEATETSADLISLVEDLYS
jgi:hypothetical protein